MPLKSFTSPLVTVGLAATGPIYILIGDTQGRAGGDGTAVRRSCSTFAARRRACSPSLSSRFRWANFCLIYSGVRMRHRPPHSQSHRSGLSVVGVGCG